MQRLQDLRSKEVIDVCDGRRLGFVCDCEFNIFTGQLLSIIVPGASGPFGWFGKNEECIIPWGNIKKIGDDIIIVDLRRRYCREPLDETPCDHGE